MSRSDRRERLSRVVHAMTAVALFAQGMGNIDQPSSRGLLVVLPLLGAALAAANVVLHRVNSAKVRHADVAATMVEGLTCAVVGVTSAVRGAHYIQYAWFLAAAVHVVGPFIKSRQARRHAGSARA